MAVSDRHRYWLIRILQTLETYFASDPGVYVSGDIMMYYKEGSPRRSVSPDVLVTFGIGQKFRRTYKVWEEGKVPEFVMEFSSKGTYQNDLGRKRELYAELGMQNYFLYDAEGLYLPSPLMGFELVNGEYVGIPLNTDGGMLSSVLGLAFHLRGEGLGIYDPVAAAWLQTPAEVEAARAEQEAARAEREVIARQQATARAEQAEAEASQLREQLARLRSRD
jgi:Uma2 family endonuclease